jgi:hypothetical protein
MPRMTAGTHTRKSLQNIAKRLRDAAAALQAVGDSIEDHGLKSVEVSYHNETLRGMSTIEKFTAAASEAVQDRLRERGEFGVLAGDFEE